MTSLRLLNCEMNSLDTLVGHSSMSTTVAERLLELLEEAGVEVVFGIAGTQTIPLLGAFERRGKPRFISARNEQGAAYMATAYARATGRPGVIVTSTGPGALNAVSGLAEARFSTLPLLHITSFADTGHFSGGIHETPMQTPLLEIVGIGAFKAAAEEIDTAFWQAWQCCTGTPAGPVSLELNARVWNKPAVLREAARSDANAAAVARPDDLGPLIDAARSAKSPLLYVGGGALCAGAKKEVVRLAQALGAPIVTSSQGKLVSDWNDPLYVGPWGADTLAHDLFKASDLAIVIGSKLSALSTLHWQMPLPAATFRIDARANVGTEPHGKYTQLANLHGDAKAACETLLANVSRNASGAEARVAAVRERVLGAARQRAPEAMRTIDVLGEFLSEDAAIALDMNKASFWFMKYLKMGSRAVQSFPSYLDMGSAIPAAIGLAEAGRKTVLASVGDGGFQMGMTEIGTLAQNRQAVSILVFNDGKYGLLKDNGVPDSVRGAKSLGIELRNPDFAKFADAFGLGYALVRSPEDLPGLLSDMREPRLLESRFEFSRQW